MCDYQSEEEFDYPEEDEGNNSEEEIDYPDENKITDFVIPEDLDDADELTSQDTSKSSDIFSVSDDPYDDIPF